MLEVFGFLFPGIFSSRIVSLGSIEIFTAHEWFPTKPIVYFRCQGENKTYLPDVKKKDILYTFNGDESWQVCGKMRLFFFFFCVLFLFLAYIWSVFQISSAVS